MKKQVLSCILLLGIMMCTSCTAKRSESVPAFSEMTTKILSVPESTDISEPQVPKTKISQKGSYNFMTTMTDTPTRLLYSVAGRLYYYNKLTEKIHIFCFDPLCHHNGDCISEKFVMNGIKTSVRYCAENNRFYAFRGDKLCSFSFDGSDLRVDYSFGENGDLKDWAYTLNVYNLSIAGSRVYFIRLDFEKGTRQLWYYDVNTRKAYNLTGHTDMAVSSYFLYRDRIYMVLTGKTESGVYISDLDFQNPEKTSGGLDKSFADGAIFHNGELYDISSHWETIDAKTHIISDEITAVSLITNEKRCVKTLQNTEMARLLAVTEDAVYYTKSEPVFIGYQDGMMGKIEIVNPRSRIYRLQNGEETVVFDDIHCEVREIYFMGNDTVLILGQKYDGDENGAERYESVFLATMDEKGHFSHAKEVRSI